MDLLEHVQKAVAKLYEYDSAYIEELSEAREEWNALLPQMEQAGIDWRDYLPHHNCEGEKLW